MGGYGSGGARVGAGRPRKSEAGHRLAGTRSRVVPMARRSTTSTAAVPPESVSGDFGVPDELTVDERNVWLRLAPHAERVRTLTSATVYGFILLCRNIVLEREIAKDPDARGGANHRGVIQRIDAELARYGLMPSGKPVVEEAKPVDPFEEFYAAPSA